MSEPWKKYAQPAPQEQPAAAPWRNHQQGRQVEYSGSILPMTRYDDGSVEFDSNAGILGPLKRAFNLPGEVYSGQIDPMSPEGIDRTIEMGATVGSGAVNPAVRSGSRAVPGPKRAIREVPAPTAEQLRDAGARQIDQAEKLPVQYSPQGFARIMDAERANLDKDGFSRNMAKKTHSVLDRFENPQSNYSLDLQGLRTARKELGKIAGQKGPDGVATADAVAAIRLIERLDKFVGNGGEGTSVAGPAGAAAQLEKTGRANYSAAKRAHRLDDIREQSIDQAGAANSGQNIGNTVRSKVNQTINNPRKSRGFNEGEVDQLRHDVTRGKKGANATRFAGNFLGGGGGLGGMASSAVGAGIGGMVGGPAGIAAGAAIPLVAGAGLKRISNNMTLKELSKINTQTRKRSPLYEQMTRQTPERVIDAELRNALNRVVMLQEMQRIKAMKDKKKLKR